MLVFGPEIERHFPLPAFAHRPGQNNRPEEDLKAPVQDSVETRVTDNNWQQHGAYLYGFVLYRAGYYWEAHEVWEPVWMQCPPNSRERLLLQAIIQIANAGLKEALGNAQASARLQGIAVGQLKEILARRRSVDTGQPLLGIDVEALMEQLKN
ncbi:MAG: DUF309 domain-containing protein [Pseudomonadota bacterium]